MPSYAHDALVQLFATRPELAAELLEKIFLVTLPSFDEIRVDSIDLSQLASTELHADLVLLLHRTPGRNPDDVRDEILEETSDETMNEASEDAADESASRRICFGLIVEVQLHREWTRRYKWPLYQPALRAKHRCPCCLLVVAPDAAIAAWASQPIQTGQPGSPFIPLVLGPALIPKITDPLEALQSPELAVLSTQAHGHGPEGLTVAQAAKFSLSGVDGEQVMIYWDMIMLALPEAVRRALEEQMQPGEYKYRSEWVVSHIKKWKREGRVQGREEGREEGSLAARRDLARKLIAEGFPVDKIAQMVELEEAEVRLLAD